MTPETLARQLESCGQPAAAAKVRLLATELECTQARLEVAIAGLESARKAGGAHSANEALQRIYEMDSTTYLVERKQ